MGKYFYHSYKFIRKHRPVFLVIMLGLFGVLFWIASSLKFEEDVSKLIPKNSENEQLQRVLNSVKFSDKIVTSISLKPNGSTSDLIDYATDFTDSISAHFKDFIKDVQGKVEDEQAIETIDFVYQNLPLFLEPEDYKVIESKLNSDSLKSITESNYKTIISPSGIVSKSFVVKDPLGLSFLGLNHLNQLDSTDGFKLKDGFLMSDDEKHTLLFLTPKYGTDNTNKNLELSKKLYQLQNDLDQHYNSKAKSSFYGGPLIAVGNAQQIKEDIQITLSIALSVLLVLFIIFYRKFAIPIILFLPTLFGGLLAITILSLIRSEISAISLGIGAVLLGVTLDYSLHILTHIRNKESVKSIYTNVSKPILMSSMTTVLAFLCLLFIDSQALQDLGVFAACSVIGASIFALIFIPQVYKIKTPTLTLKPTFVDAVARFDFHKNKIIIGGIVLLTILSAFTFNNVVFNNNLSQLNYVSEDLKQAEKKLDALTNISSKSLYVIAFGNSSEEALQSNDSVFKILTKLKKNNDILDYNSVGALVKSEQYQQDQIEQWKKFWTTEKTANTEKELRESGSQFGFKPSTFEEFYAHLNKDFKILSTDDFKKIPSLSTDDFISNEGNLSTITSVVKIDEQHIEKLKSHFESNENVMVIDRQGINESLLGKLKSEFNTLITLTLVAIFLLLIVFYRGLKLAIVTMLPILLTWFLTLGIMGLFQLEFNIFNIIITTFIFGLGVDYCIFMTNGLQQHKDIKVKLPTYKTSVILSVITTVLGVGVLVFAKHPALHSIALVSIIGIVSALLVAFTIQPILYKFLVTKNYSL
ncbi:MMPL family transporter [Winogradskyella sp. A3E31]|uniref:MMPL family transporter n=1 Tax=Winogradskyella sp. A3E31 TaxID=3349637 RepID=UPI00398A94DD